ncbi:2-dehydropantoate 2-reductase [Aestuariibacter sp. GS-14]|nr:2-dehydropantoate 2-reductase [Aestuariibacter sp. GS-14]
MRWCMNIVGSGAIGGLCAAGAQHANLPYRAIVREHSNKLRFVEGLDGTITHLDYAEHDIAKLGEHDVLILPLKAFQIGDALQQWQKRINKATPVILFHNGMGGTELATTWLPDNPVFLATTSHGALKLNADTVKHTGMGSTMLGMAFSHPLAKKLQPVVTALMEACIGPVTWREDMQTALWQKLLINCAINPLTALENVKNGALANPQYRATLQLVCQEVCLTAQACGVQLDEENALEQVLAVVRNTAENYSSMHQDIAHHRPSEIDAINGYVVQQAQKKGIDVPVNTRLFLAIKAL